MGKFFCGHPPVGAAVAVAEGAMHIADIGDLNINPRIHSDLRQTLNHGEIHVLCVVKALCYEVTHDGTGDAADDVHDHGDNAIVLPGKQRPGNMIDSHGDHGDGFDGICIQCSFHSDFLISRLLA